MPFAPSKAAATADGASPISRSRSFTKSPAKEHTKAQPSQKAGTAANQWGQLLPPILIMDNSTVNPTGDPASSLFQGPTRHLHVDSIPRCSLNLTNNTATQATPPLTSAFMLDCLQLSYECGEGLVRTSYTSEKRRIGITRGSS